MHQTVIGCIQPMHTVHKLDERTLPRKYFYTDFDPSEAFIELAEAVANSVGGAASAIRTSDKGTSFALVCQFGYDPDTIAPLFMKVLTRKLSSISKSKRHELIHDGHVNSIEDALAVSSIDTTGLTPTRFGYADG